MLKTAVMVSFATRRGVGQLFSDDAIGLNGWALHGNAAGMVGGMPGDFQQSPLPGPLLVAVADGVSGHPAAASASLAAAEQLTRVDLASKRSTLVNSANALHTHLTGAASELGMPGTPGTTVAGAIVTVQGTVICFNIGDSRVYRTSAGSLVQMSRDDVDARGGLAMWLGRPDVSDVEPFVTILEPVRSQRILLCTDGLYRTVGANLLQALMCGEPSVTPRQLVDALISAAEGSIDDAAAIVIETATRHEPAAPGADLGRTVAHLPNATWQRPEVTPPHLGPTPPIGSPQPMGPPQPVDPTAQGMAERPRGRFSSWLRGSDGPHGD